MKKRKIGFKLKIWIIFLFALTLSLISVIWINNELRPTLLAYCDQEARRVATETINNSIKTEFSNKISYDDIMAIKTDKDGNIVMIQANTVELNVIGSQIALEVQKRIADIKSRTAEIPLSALTGIELLANLGPRIPFNMKPVGSVLTSYRSEFASAGINQTRHIVYLDCAASVQVIIPLARNTVTVSTSIPIAESIIVGKVPNTYAEINSDTIERSIKEYNTNKK
ncbi:Sporulation protein YunB [Caloramator mitchellensis]|uniref:Sporulation protein YunB n=1 Tax=Caloramator mitchellensis TaxID=908809 RepID=A0A0R3K2F0_CALMK|nr:sporulation protein YunB [Caloramator mitchellensis]KRQ87484.1 Sporulation protein YunB [Caloramator mitchellensis]